VALLRHPDQQGPGSKLGGGAALPTGGLRRLYRFLAWVAATVIALPVSLASELLLRPRRTHPEPNAGAGQAADAGVAGGDAAWQQAGSRQQEVTPDAALISGDDLGDAVALPTADDSGGGVGFGLPFAGLLRWLVVDLLWGYVVHPVWDVVSDVAAYYWSGEGADRCRKRFPAPPPPLTPSSATCLLVRCLTCFPSPPAWVPVCSAAYTYAHGRARHLNPGHHVFLAVDAPVFLQVQAAKRAMRSARSYDEWLRHAHHVDQLNDAQRWKMRFESDVRYLVSCLANCLPSQYLSCLPACP